MTEGEIVVVKDAILRLQLGLLEGIQSEDKLNIAGSLLSRNDYQDVVTERSITKLCGYPLCSHTLPLETPKKGRYRISLKEHKVYDLQETYMFCSTSCVVNSRAFALSLQEERSSSLNPAKLTELVRMFESSSLDESTKDPVRGNNSKLSALRIHENLDPKAEGLTLEDWIGPSNAIEGYVSQNDSTLNQQVGNKKLFITDDLNKSLSGESSVEKSNHLKSTALKSCLKSSIGTKETGSVTWADKKTDGGSSKSLCDFSDGRFLSAEACAKALAEAAEAVASGEPDVSNALAEAGIVVQPPPVDIEEYNAPDKFDSDDSEPYSLKWPAKSSSSESDLLESSDSWYDELPEGLELRLSPFATMYMALFAWTSASSLAYIYGHDDSLYEEYMDSNGREYPRKTMAPDGRSLEIKQALAGCLARALPGLVTDLRLPVPVSFLETNMQHLLETMSFMDALPPFTMKQWQLFALLFLDALSVCRIPTLIPHMTGTRISLPKLCEAAQISAEEYEVLKDLMIPPQFAMHY